jgi:hypothetical protein
MQEIPQDNYTCIEFAEQWEWTESGGQVLRVDRKKWPVLKTDKQKNK